MTAVTRELPATDRDAAIQSLAKLLAHYLPGKPVEVTVRQRKRARTDIQNAALWGCAYKALHEQSGNDAEDLHRFFCGERWGWVEQNVLGRRQLKPVRTTTVNEHGERDVIDKHEFADFYDFIQRRAAEAGYDVPDPDPAWRLREAA